MFLSANNMQTEQYAFHRVKVYKLNGNGGWDDKGTGLVSVEYMEQSDSMGLVVISEDDPSRTLLVHKISRDDIYHRQGEDTIISWSDPEVNTDIALSFQEAHGCNSIWQQMKQVQRDDNPRGSAEVLSRRRVAVDEFEQTPGDFQETEQGYVELPAPELGALDEVARVLSHVSPFHRERIAAQLLRPGYLRALLDLFRTAEDLEDAPSLANLFRIVKGAIMLNDPQVLEEVLKEEHVMDIVGALEYDPDLKQQQKHREFLRDCVVFKEVVPITDPVILAKVHQTYRIQYLKDVVLPRALDDATYATLSSLALFNNVEVIVWLQQDPQFLSQLFVRLKKHSPNDSEWHDLVAFLQEFCGLAKHLQPAHRQLLFNKLVTLGMFEVATKILQHSSPEVKLRATDILMSAMQHDPTPLRHFLYSQKDHELFALLIDEFVQGSTGGLAEQVAELLKMLLDPETMEQSVEKNDFLEMFYDKYVAKVVDVLVTDKATASTGTRYVPANTLGLIVELLCFCVQHHSYRIKYYTLKHNLVEKVLRLLRRKEKWLVCAAVRFMRTCIGLKDEFYNRYLVRNNLFEPIMNAFFENGDRYNLLNSAVLELVDFIRRENIKGLLMHLVEQYSHKFEDIDYVETFKQLKLKFDQSQERMGDVSTEPAGGPASIVRGRTYVFPAGEHGHVLPMRRRREERELDKDEEDYFSEDADSSDDHRPRQSVGRSIYQTNTMRASTTVSQQWLGLTEYDDQDDDGDQVESEEDFDDSKSAEGSTKRAAEIEGQESKRPRNQASPGAKRAGPSPTASTGQGSSQGRTGAWHR